MRNKVFVFNFKHRDTEIQNDILSMPQIQSSFNLNTKKQRNKGYFPDRKGTSDLKVATKHCG